MKIWTSAIIAAAIGLMLATTAARAAPPMDPDGASVNAHWQCGLKCGMDRACYRACLAEFKD